MLPELLEIQETFDLDRAELAGLLGIEPAVLAGDGVPPSCFKAVDEIRGLARRIGERFVPQQVPRVVRSPMPGLNGKSILETIAATGVDPVNAMFDRTFSYVPE
jgi:hypothetical protein